MKDLIKLIYSLFIGVAVAAVATTTVSAVYPAPAFPEQAQIYNTEPTEEQLKADEENYKKYDEESADHATKTAVYTAAGAISVFLLGLLVRRLKRIDGVISEGILLGGLFTAIYAASRGFSTYYLPPGMQAEAWVSSAASAVALIMAIVIAQLKFSPRTNKRKK